ncbi:DUF4189 domain-containing protein [Neisseria animalis]|uniref:DUF4189 domain-containing protein n=1 Tax=Neisseria animalis TaxID=492 RepID=A0A5P3MTV6_NEIAN|nr:DUF4189 domain-containing protein [Neisseria animalis]QEY25057.1 DUF4189 domain-containing protein [Neisseria animalis]ROW33141.1 DUF4189 domain-containing protein [Neisseria animalis]VEE07250.1 Uncharacterised protein [Neisseria animalis]
MKKTLSALIISLLASGAVAADSYGFLALWQNPNDVRDTQVKTTRENATYAAAKEELDAYCRAQDTLAGVPPGGATGCKTVVPLHNTCAALAYPKAEIRLTPENAVIITSPRFKSVHQTAISQCMKKYGSAGQCTLELAYCTANDYYGGLVKSLLYRLK